MDLEKVYCVYVHENKINGKRYVGITKQEPNARWHNGKNYEDSPRLNNAIQKYGWDNFDHRIIASELTLEEAAEMEKSLIKIWMLQDDRFGYNIKDGGQGGPIKEETKKKIGNANRGRKASAETKKKLSEAHKGRKHTIEEREKISKANKGKAKPEQWVLNRIGLNAGEKHHLFGKHLSEETREKMSASRREYYKTHAFPVEPVRKSVKQIETGHVFTSIEEAAKTLNICRSSISECCAGKRKSAGGFHWEFVS